MSRKIRNFRTNKFDSVTNGNFDSCNRFKRLGTSRLHQFHQSKFPFVTRIEFIRSKLSNFSAHVSGVRETRSHDRRVLRARRAGREATNANQVHQIPHSGLCLLFPRTAHSGTQPLRY